MVTKLILLYMGTEHNTQMYITYDTPESEKLGVWLYDTNYITLVDTTTAKTAVFRGLRETSDNLYVTYTVDGISHNNKIIGVHPWPKDE